MKTNSWISNEISHLSKKGFSDFTRVDRELIWTLKKYYMNQIKLICIVFVLFGLFLTAFKSHAQSGIDIVEISNNTVIPNDSTIIFRGDTLHFSGSMFTCDTVNWYIAGRPNDTIPVYIVYFDTKSSNVYSPPKFTNAQFENESTRKMYDNNMYWTHGYLVISQWDDRYFLNDKKKRFSENIVIFDWRHNE